MTLNFAIEQFSLDQGQLNPAGPAMIAFDPASAAGVYSAEGGEPIPFTGSVGPSSSPYTTVVSASGMHPQGSLKLDFAYTDDLLGGGTPIGGICLFMTGRWIRFMTFKGFAPDP